MKEEVEALKEADDMPHTNESGLGLRNELEAGDKFEPSMMKRKAEKQITLVHF